MKTIYKNTKKKNKDDNHNDDADAEELDESMKFVVVQQGISKKEHFYF